jgi:flagellar hook-length control protein FliK
MSAAAVEPGVPTLPAGVLGNPPAADVGAAQAFAVAIQLALGVPHAVPATPTSPGTPPSADAATGDGSTDADVSPKGSEDASGTAVAGTAPVVDAAVAGLLALVPAPTPVPVLVPVPTPVKDAANDDVAVPGSTKGTPQLALATAPAAAPTVAPAPAPTVAPAAAAPVASTPASTAPDSASAKDERSDATTPAPTRPPATDAQPAPTTVPTAPTAPTPQVPVAAPVATAAPVAAPTPTAPAAAPHAVSEQVIPEVTRLFSNGEGVHRVTLELNPRALGEVRVVLTVRNGDVHVRLAAGSEAREALAHSAGDLTRALEHIGVKDHRLTLAELPGVTPGTATQTQSDTTDSQQQQYASFTGRFDTEHHHDSRQPRMGDGSRATDGTDHDNGTRTHGDRSIHEVSTVPVRGGVDLRM